MRAEGAILTKGCDGDRPLNIFARISMTNNNKTTDDRHLERLLTLLSRFRILNLQQVRVVLPEGQPNFDTLAKAGLIHFWPAPTVRGAMQHLVALARGGALVLARKIGCEVSDVPYLTPVKLKRSLFTLEHTLLVTELGLVLEKLSETNAHGRQATDRENDSPSTPCIPRAEPRFRLLRFETAANRIGTSVRLIREGEVWNVPLVADALVDSSFDGRTHSFLVEIDRGTTTYARMRRKFLGYERWWREHGPLERFGVRNLRLLVLTSSEERLKRLKTAVEEDTGGKGVGFIWFGLLADVSLENPARILDPVWQKVSSPDNPQSLFDRCPGPPAQP